MQCSYHPDRLAVGACKSCGKGLCAECAVDLGDAFACRGRCESDLPALTSASARKTRAIALGISCFLLLLGAIACFHLSTMDTVWIQLGGADKGLNGSVPQDPRTDTLTRTEKLGYRIMGLVLLAGSAYGLITLVRPKKNEHTT